MGSNPGRQDMEHVDKPRAELASGAGLHSRRAVVRRGVRLAFMAPVISTFYASQAYATNYSCYVAGHKCNPAPDWEPCCNGLSCIDDVVPPISPTGKECR